MKQAAWRWASWRTSSCWTRRITSSSRTSPESTWWSGSSSAARSCWSAAWAADAGRAGAGLFRGPGADVRRGRLAAGAPASVAGARPGGGARGRTLRPRDETKEAQAMSSEARPVIRAPRGTELSCKGWQQEAALRMLMNNLDPEVAERPEELIVYGGSGKAARDWESFHRIVETLRELENDETLLIQSGKPVGVFRTHPYAPRVLLANANLVPAWGTWEEFWRLEAMGLTMYGQMTAGSWIYIGTQGILQGTYETFAECASQHFGGTLKGRWVLTGGCGGMGGAQPLAITMNEGVALVVEVDPERLQRRIDTRYLDRMTDDLDEALRWVEEA